MKLQAVAWMKVATEVDMEVVMEVVTQTDIIEVVTVEVMKGEAELCMLKKVLLRPDVSPNTVIRAAMKQEPTPDTEAATEVATVEATVAATVVATEVAMEVVMAVVTKHSDVFQATSEMKPTE